MHIGYIRVSSCDQHTDRQLEGVALDRTYRDRLSGKDINRPELQRCLANLQNGDVLHVHSLDRLTRNLKDLIQLLEELMDRGVAVHFHKEKLIFSKDGTPFEKLHLHIIGAVSEFERSMIRERQREGIALARNKGKYTGRKPLIDDEDAANIVRRAAGRESVRRIAGDYGVSPQTVYRILRRNHLK